MFPIALTNPINRPVIRYAAGASLLVAVSMGFDWVLAFLLPVLSMSFLAPGGKPPGLKGGLFFVGSITIACFLGMTLAYSFLPMPPIHILVTFLLLFHIFYTRHAIFNPLVKVWLLVAILLIPNIALQSMVLAKVMAISLVWNAACAILLIWIIYLVFPLTPESQQSPTKGKSQDDTPGSGRNARFNTALTSTLVIMPVYLTFYFATIPNALLILVFIAILSMQPAFAKDWKVGKALIIGNIIGGLAAIIAYEILTVVPEFNYLILLVLLAGLVFGLFVFDESPMAAVFGMAFSTFLLIIGSVTGSDGDGAGGKVWSRVIQIMIAVVYAVSAFGLIAKFKSSNEKVL
ncbi:MAG: hypothetical protein DHS20C17_25710 [Cyclobacteriaceae bacterium]|nr:MAG: hypothetical protein DHS20C17_25710 [Cyclobacteriaceae bacterium]